MADQVVHGTYRFARTMAFSASAVFGAFRDPGAREAWSPPGPEEAVSYAEADFRVGGLDRSFCGPKGRQEFEVEARYLDIVADERIVLSELIRRTGAPLAVSLTTVLIISEPLGSSVHVTVQAVSFVGPEMLLGFEEGWSASLDGLANYLASG